MASVDHESNPWFLPYKGATSKLRALLLSLPAMLGSAAYAADPHPVLTYSRQAKFAHVREDATAAFEGGEFVFDHEAHVNRMREGTGSDAGSARTP